MDKSFSKILNSLWLLVALCLFFLSNHILGSNPDSTKFVIPDSLEISLQNIYQNGSVGPISEVYYSTVNNKLDKPLKVRVLTSRDLREVRD